jgi:hypothetical protein
MKTALRALVIGVFLLPLFGNAQNKAAIQAAESACGPADARMKAELLPLQAKPAATGIGQGVVYIVGFSFNVHPTYKIEAGVDGAWQALIESSGHIAVPLAPGLHHVCVRIANNLVDYKNRRIAVTDIDVEAGQTHYLVASAGVNWLGENGWPIIALRPVNEDEGKFLVASTRTYGLQGH